MSHPATSARRASVDGCRVICVCLVVAALAGCRDGPERDPRKESNNAGADAGPLTLVGLLRGTRRPTLPGPLAKLRFGMPADAACRAVKALCHAEVLHDRRSRPPVELQPVWRTGPRVGRRLAGLHVLVPQAGSRAVIEAAWGPPHLALDATDARWINPDERIRARLSTGLGRRHTISLVLEPIMTVEDLLRPGPGLFGFGNSRLLGLDEARVREVFAGHFKLWKTYGGERVAHLSFLPVGWAHGETVVAAVLREGVVHRYVFDVSMPGPAQLGPVLEGLERRFGKPASIAGPEGEQRFVWAQDPPLKAFVRDGTTLSVFVGPWGEAWALGRPTGH